MAALTPQADQAHLATHHDATPLIEVAGLTKTYQTPAGLFTALGGIDLRIFPGEFVGVIGKSGSGKSTFINMLTGIDRPTTGEVTIGGVSLPTLDETAMARWRGRHLGIVFQFFQLLPTLTLLENLILPMELNGLYSRTSRRERALHLLEQVDLASQAGKLPGAVSGGQQQRAAIARALAYDPPLIVADEPTGNLDSKTADAIFALFAQLAAGGKTIVIVTHDTDQARRVDRTILISDGKVVNEYLARALAVLDYDQLAEVAGRVEPLNFASGATVVRQGETGDKFYVILEGQVDVLAVAVGTAGSGLMLTGGWVLAENLQAQYASTRPAHAVLDVSTFDENLLEDIRSMRGAEAAEARRLIRARTNTGPDKSLRITHYASLIAYPRLRRSA